MNKAVFEDLPTTEVARLVREAGPKVCVFPINGTRRWFSLEHGTTNGENLKTSYLEISGQRHIELYRLLFDHGIDTLVTPVFGPDILERGEDYRAVLERGLVWFAQNRDFLEFYADYDVRVQVYGDAERHLRETPYAYVAGTYEDLKRCTAAHQRRRLFFGVCANDAAKTVAEIGIRFQQQYGRAPDRREIVEAYYGEYIPPADLFIGFDRPAAFDMPLIATGSEDLYFTVSPSPYLDARTLRAILYDHLYARRVDDGSYDTLSPRDWRAMADFYTDNRRAVLGLGRKHRSGSFWYPLPQVEMSPLLEDEAEVEPIASSEHSTR